MTLTDYPDLASALHRQMPALLDLAGRAGREIMAVYQASTPSEVLYKADASPVTQADLLANDILMAGLAELFPEVPVVTEEAEASLANRHPVDPFWLVDPLDGTREFINRSGQFTVNMALVLGSYPVAGVIGAPAIGEMFWAIEGLGAFEHQAGHDRPLQATPYPSGGPVRVLASQNNMNDATRQWLVGLGEHELRQAGSSLKFCRVAQGLADCYPRLAPTAEWDTAAGQAIVEAAGGAVRQLDGARLACGIGDSLNPHFIVTGPGAPWPLAGQDA